MQSDDRPKRFVEILTPAFEQASAIATALQGRVANRPKTREASEVKAALTVADTAAQETLLVPLLDGFAGSRLEAEEDTPSVTRFSGADPRQRIVIDPIDGTFRFYLGQQGPYAMMAGWALDDVFRAALVSLPTERVLLTAVEGQGAHSAKLPAESGVLSPQALRVETDTRAGRLLVSDTIPPALHEALEERGFEPILACGGAISVAPLLPGVAGGLRFASEASASGISTRGRVGALIAREAGAYVGRLDRTAFPHRIDEAASTLLVARDEEVAERIRAAILR